MEHGTRWTLHKKCGKLTRTIPDEFADFCAFCGEALSAEERFTYRVSGEFGSFSSKNWKEFYDKTGDDY